MSKALLKGNKKVKVMKTPCLLCSEDCSELCKLSVTSWNSLKDKASLWTELDRFGGVYHNVKWEEGPTGKYLHSTCRLQISSKRLLEQSLKRKHVTCKVNNTEQPAPKLSVRVPTRGSTGQLHNKGCCIWCMKPRDTKHNERKESSLHVLTKV